MEQKESTISNYKQLTPKSSERSLGNEMQEPQRKAWPLCTKGKVPASF